MHLLLMTLLAAAPTQKSIAVIPLTTGGGVDQQMAVALTDALTAEFRKFVDLKIVSTSEVEATMSFEKQRDLMGCTDSTCMSELGGALGVDYLSVGRLSRLGTSWLLSLKIVNIRTAGVMAQSDRRFKGGSLDDVLDLLPAMVTEMVNGAFPGGYVEIATDPNGLAVTINGKAVGHAPIPSMRLAPGQYTLGIDDECLNASHQLSLRIGEHQKVILHATAKLSDLDLHLKGPNGEELRGEASVDDQPLGSVPGKFRVATCAHQVKVVGNQGGAWSAPLTFVDGKASIDAVLGSGGGEVASVSTTGPHAKGIGWGWLAGGAGAVVGGVVLDNILARQHEAGFQPLDLLPIVLYAGGAALATVGVLQAF